MNISKIEHLNRQRGMTIIGWLLILALIGVGAALSMKIVPIYLQHYSVRNVLDSLHDEPLITKKTVGKVRTMVLRRLDINGIYDIDKDNVKVTKTPGVMRVAIEYTVQKDIVGNMDILISFSEQTELVSN